MSANKKHALAGTHLSKALHRLELLCGSESKPKLEQSELGVPVLGPWPLSPELGFTYLGIPIYTPFCFGGALRDRGTRKKTRTPPHVSVGLAQGQRVRRGESRALVWPGGESAVNPEATASRKKLRQGCLVWVLKGGGNFFLVGSQGKPEAKVFILGVASF